MTRAEAVAVIDSVVRYFSKQGNEETSSELDEAACVLGVYRIPDPDTGLMPCGCGMKAERIRLGYQKAVACVNGCAYTGWCDTQEEADAKWNRSRGVKEKDNETK
jgi:hypothetical protein